MKETIFKSLLISLLITNIWSVVVFFIYYYDSPGLFGGLKTLLIFGFSCWISAGLGILTILFSLLKIPKLNQLKVFLLVLTGWFNIFFSVLLVITAIIKIIIPQSYIDAYFIVNFIIPIVLYFLTRKLIKTTSTTRLTTN
jgi:hypothetical protein